MPAPPLNPMTGSPTASLGIVSPTTIVREAEIAGSTEAAVATLRVLHVVNGEHFSGAERVQSHLGRCLPAVGVTADFACVKPGRFADMLDSRAGDKDHWGRCFRLPMRHRLDRSSARRLAELVRDGQYELMHAHTPRTAMLASAVSNMTGIPWIYHVHSPASRDGSQWIRNRVNAFVERRSLRNSAHQIAVSNSLKADLIAQGAFEKDVSVVFNGVPAIRPQRQTRPVVGGTWTIGMIALMRARKGLEVALDALAELDAEGLDVNLRCIGPFETVAYRRQIDQQIDRLGLGHRVQWMGFTDDVPGELSRLDAMVLPSLYGEGLPMVVLESMAAGTPVIATRVEGTPEAIRHGEDGLLAEPRNATSLASEIQSLVTGQHDWQTMAESAVARHGECFSDTAMAAQTAEVYRRVLGQC